MKHFFLSFIFLISFSANLLYAQIVTMHSPNEELKLCLFIEEGQPTCSLDYAGKTILEKSPLGVITNEGDFSKNLVFTGYETSKVDKSYTQEKIKQSSISYQA